MMLNSDEIVRDEDSNYILCYVLKPALTCTYLHLPAT